MCVHVDDRAIASELEAQGELIALVLRERCGVGAGGLRALVSVGRLRELHPYADGGSAPGEPCGSPAASMTFGTLTVGDGNREAASLASAVAESPGLAGSNPLLVYGGEGLGKIHVLLAILNRMAEARPDLNVAYISVADFLTALAEGGGSDRVANDGSRAPFLAADVLLVDDVQLLSKLREEARDVFFSVCNEIVGKGGQLVFSSDRAPRDMDISEGHQSRLNAGMTVAIGNPSFEARLRIARNFSARCRRALGCAGLHAGAEELIASDPGLSVREVKAAVGEAYSAMLHGGEAAHPG